MPSKFEFRSQSAFLTYAQCPVPKDQLMAHLKSKIGTREGNQLVKACIGQEKHQDGNLHLHICAWYTTQLYFTDPTYLDIPYEGKFYHPNISDRIKSKKKALAYTSKSDPEPLQFNMDLAQEL